ncbi:hypothetical protein A6R68_01882, partial [Neotoma lepida]
KVHASTSWKTQWVRLQNHLFSCKLKANKGYHFKMDTIKMEKTPKVPKRPSSIEDIKSEVQANMKRGGSLLKVEAKFI